MYLKYVMNVIWVMCQHFCLKFYEIYFARSNSRQRGDYRDMVQINELKFVEKVRKVNCEKGGGIDEVVDNQIGMMPATYLWHVGGFPRHCSGIRPHRGQTQISLK